MIPLRISGYSEPKVCHESLASGESFVFFVQARIDPPLETDNHSIMRVHGATRTEAIFRWNFLAIAIEPALILEGHARWIMDTKGE